MMNSGRDIYQRHKIKIYRAGIIIALLCLHRRRRLWFWIIEGLHLYSAKLINDRGNVKTKGKHKLSITAWSSMASKNYGGKPSYLRQHPSPSYKNRKTIQIKTLRHISPSRIKSSWMTVKLTPSTNGPVISSSMCESDLDSWLYPFDQSSTPPLLIWLVVEFCPNPFSTPLKNETWLVYRQHTKDKCTECRNLTSPAGLPDV